MGEPPPPTDSSKVFDPGTNGDEVVHVELILPHNMVSADDQILAAIVAQYQRVRPGNISPMHRHGTVHCIKDTTVEVSNALFDCGALHASYMSSNFYDANKDNLSPITAVTGYVKLGDQKTLCPLRGSVNAEISFLDVQGNTHTATVKFHIFDMKDIDIIIGLPHIARDFHAMFTSMVWELNPSYESLSAKSAFDNEFVSVDIPEGTILPPWSSRQETAPEENDIPDPATFAQPLHFMANSYEKNCEDYLANLESHISTELRESPWGKPSYSYSERWESR